MRTIYLDIETTVWFDAPHLAHLARWQQLARLNWGLCETWSADVGWQSWPAEAAPILWEQLTLPDTQVVTWNGDEFDLPRIALEALRYGYDGLPHADPLNSFDLMAWIIKETKRLDGKGRWYKLDTIADVNLGRRKVADGKQAAVWLSSGTDEEVRLAAQYCRDDVQIVRDLHQRLIDGHALLCPARPDRREYTDLRLTLGAREAMAKEP